MAVRREIRKRGAHRLQLFNLAVQLRHVLQSKALHFLAGSSLVLPEA